MKIDIYTKGVLTIIAACLVYLCLGQPSVMSPVEAQDRPSKVIIAGFDRDGIEALYNGPLPVVVSQQPPRR